MTAYEINQARSISAKRAVHTVVANGNKTVVTTNLNEEKLSTNSPWNFEHIFDTREHY